MVAPIPLYCEDNAGSGFLVTDNSAVWLLTCVHVVTGLQETPPAARLFTTARIHIAGRGDALSLFVNGQQRFSVVTNTTTGNLIDAMAIKLTRDEIVRLGTSRSSLIAKGCPALKVRATGCQ